MIPGCLRNAAVTTVWRKRNEPGCRISNFPSPTFTRADGRCKKSNFPSLSFALADIWRRILNFPSLFEREQIRKVQNLVQTQRKRGLSPVFAFGKFEFLHQTRKHSHGKRKRPAGASAKRATRDALPSVRTLLYATVAQPTRAKLPAHARSAPLHRQDEGPVFAMRGVRPEGRRRGLLARLHRQDEGFAFDGGDA